MPALLADISDVYPNSVPVFFWSTREGSRVALETMPDYPVRVVAAFARRPKVRRCGQADVLVKFNESLFEYAQRADAAGIPTLAGVPLASSLLDLRPGCRSSWFRIVGRSRHAPVFMKLDRDSGMATSGSRDGLRGPLAGREITQIIDTEATVMPWAEAAERLRSLRRDPDKGLSWFRWGYRPFHVVAFDEDPSQRGGSARTRRVRESAVKGGT